MEIVLAILGGGIGTALVGGGITLLQWYLNRKAALKDRENSAASASCAARGEEIRDLKRLVGVLREADRTLLYDRIKHLGKSYIAREYVTVEELEDLQLMHSVYHDRDKLNGNGFLDELMKSIHALKKRAS
jgi:hypothetical protein